MNRLVRKSLLRLGLYDITIDFKLWLTSTEAKYVRFYSQFIKEDDLCFDVGANVGRRIKVFLKLKNRVVAVEPQAHCINILKKKYKNNNRVILVEKAIGEKESLKEMLICDAHSLSSLSNDWINSVKDSGRYAENIWEKRVTVQVVTLDSLIAQYGKPSFIKIDVEGYEYEALKGLSQPIKVICYEFTPEFMDSALSGVRHLAGIGLAEFNYSLANQPTKLVLSNWISSDQICYILDSLSDTPTVGDVFVRFRV
jgi:FkbM family methyltransferase